MNEKNSRFWHFNREVNISILIQLVFLASLIVGSWINLQRQLDFLQKDVSSLLERQKMSAEKVDALQEKVISHEFRLKHLERDTSLTRRPE